PFVRCPATTSSAIPASLSASDSPTHTIAVRPASRAAFVFEFTDASVSPKNCLRSVWPIIVYLQPTSFSIVGATSPVNAPKPFCVAQSCAAMPIFEPSRRSATVLSAVNTGAMTTSQCVAFATRGFRASAVSTASPTRLYIFQFPAITAFLITIQIYRCDRDAYISKKRNGTGMRLRMRVRSCVPKDGPSLFNVFIGADKADYISLLQNCSRRRVTDQLPRAKYGYDRSSC